jgi:hypothetical protein
VFLGADPGTLEGVGILLGIFLASICAGPYLFAWFFPRSSNPYSLASWFMLVAVLAAIGFSIYIIWTFEMATGAASDPLMLVVIPIYLSVGLGISAGLASMIDSLRAEE